MSDGQGTLYTTAQAARFLNVHPATLANWRSQGRGPKYAKLSPGRRGKVLYPLSELQAFVKSHLQQSTAEG